MERAIMVAVFPKGRSRSVVDRQLDELQGLIFAAGGEVVGSIAQAREVPEAGLGRGALQSLAVEASDKQATLIVFDQELSASTLNTVQRAVGQQVRVVDRTELILDIFARRASSREGRVQVELAQYRYMEPRVRGGTALSRQGGGIGTRGPGETRLEMDRRIMRRRIRELSEELAQVERQRRERRQRRQRTEIPVVAFVGYTNVGKSTLYSLLTHREQATGNALFVTLDSTVRRMLVPDFGPVLVSDTVGFVDRLPHGLVAAFRSTLAEVRDADVLVEVVSADPSFPVSPREQARVIEETVAGLGAKSKPVVRVYSQADLAVSRDGFDDGVLVSSLTSEGVPEFLSRLSQSLSRLYRQEEVRIPWEAAKAWRVVYGEFTIVSRDDQGDVSSLVLRGPERAFWLLHRALQGERSAFPMSVGVVK